MNNSKKWFNNNRKIVLWYFILIMFALARIVLSAGYVYDYIVSAGMDDMWMVKTAYYLLGRQWLGTYNHVTLIKSLTYPFMLAFFRAFSIPYGMGIGVFYVLISFVFARALKPIVKSVYFRGLIFLSVLYSPVGFLTITSGRIYRNSVSHWMALFVIASVIGIYLRRDNTFRQLWKWFLCEVVAFMMFWELREDHIWILAFVIPASLILLIYWLCHNKKWWKTIIVIVLPFVAVSVMKLGIAGMNYHRYGVFTTNDRTGTYCGKVMSLLYKIDDGDEHDQRIWVSNGALEQAKAVSPTLDSISWALDSDWNFWKADTIYGAEVPGDHAEWALRQTMLDAGYYRDAVNTNEFYKKIYEELSEGFKSGKLKTKKGISISSQMRPFTFEDIDKALELTFPVVGKYARFDSPGGIYVAYTTDGMDERDKSIFENMLLMNITEYGQNSRDIRFFEGNYASICYGEFIMGVLDKVWNLYKIISTFLNYISISILIFMFIRMIFELRKKQFDSFYAFLLTAGILLLLIVYTFMICLWGLWMTLDPGNPIYWFYGSPGPMLAQVFRILCIVYMYNYISSRIRNKKEKVNEDI
ncbi:MAG: hypothetical protein IJV15_08940 [Lachnospiraceae bacterium]|nr:hypothetical protein [Lachnospiraceae bacterium]